MKYRNWFIFLFLMLLIIFNFREQSRNSSPPFKPPKKSVRLIAPPAPIKETESVAPRSPEQKITEKNRNTPEIKSPEQPKQNDDNPLLPPPLPNNHKKIVVYLDEQMAYCYEAGENEPIRQIKISSGRPGYETPIGHFLVTRKNLRSWSQRYQAPMPHSVWFVDLLYAIHASDSVPANPASHGCIRMPPDEAEWFFDWAEINMPVIINKSR